MEIHFISGLPRSGSSLLASILRQNPRYEASFSSPIGYTITALHQGMTGQNEARGLISDSQRLRILRGIFSAFYADAGADVVFDNNRRWCAQLPLLMHLFPNAKVICCVRPIAHIIDSLERLIRAHPLELSAIYGWTPNTTVYERVRMLMEPGGLVGYALSAVRDAFYGPHRDRLIMVEYAELAQHPAAVMRRIEDELFGTLPTCTYDFNNILPLPGAAEFDASLGLPGLHALKSRVVYDPNMSVLPPDIYGSMPEPFWRQKPVKKTATNAS